MVRVSHFYAFMHLQPHMFPVAVKRCRSVLLFASVHMRVVNIPYMTLWAIFGWLVALNVGVTFHLSEKHLHNLSFKTRGLKRLSCGVPTASTFA